MSGLVATVRDVAFADGTSADVDLVASGELAEEARTFGAMVFLTDAGGDFALVHSVRRAEWGPPGGWREEGESVWDTVVRETVEEVGIVLPRERLTPVGHEVFRPHAHGGLWLPGLDVLQCFAARLEEVRPPLSASLDDTSDREWVTPAGLARRCGGQFWWPLFEAVRSAAG